MRSVSVREHIPLRHGVVVIRLIIQHNRSTNRHLANKTDLYLPDRFKSIPLYKRTAVYKTVKICYF